MAVLFLAVASTINNVLMIRMTNQAEEKAAKDQQYIISDSVRVGMVTYPHDVEGHMSHRIVV